MGASHTYRYIKVPDKPVDHYLFYPCWKMTAYSYTFTFSTKNIFITMCSGYLYKDSYDSGLGGNIKTYGLEISRNGTVYYSHSYKDGVTVLSTGTSGKAYCLGFECSNVNVQAGDVITLYDRGGTMTYYSISDRYLYGRAKATSQTFTSTFDANHIYVAAGSGYNYGNSSGKSCYKVEISRNGTVIKTYLRYQTYIFHSGSEGNYPYCTGMFIMNAGVKVGDTITVYDIGGAYLTVTISGF